MYTILPKTEHFALGQIFIWATRFGARFLQKKAAAVAAAPDCLKRHPSTNSCALTSVFLIARDWFFFYSLIVFEIGGEER